MSNVEIEECIEGGNIRIEPLRKENVGPDSIDIRLGNKLLIARKVGRIIDPAKKIDMEFDEHELKKESYALKRGDFVLGITLEKIGLSNNVVAQLEGRSSLGRLGIVIHMTAGLIHAGWGLKEPSPLTLEISSVNPNPVYLHYGMRIAQLSFLRLRTPARIGYDENQNSKYVGQKEPLPSKMHEDG